MIGQPPVISFRIIHGSYAISIVVTERRSTADERAIYYSLDLETVSTLYQAAGGKLSIPVLQVCFQMGYRSQMCPSLASLDNGCLLCTENSARSNGRGTLRHLSRGGLEVSKVAAKCPNAGASIRAQVL
jgi:hypothetical protein